MVAVLVVLLLPVLIRTVLVVLLMPLLGVSSGPCLGLFSGTCFLTGTVFVGFSVTRIRVSAFTITLFLWGFLHSQKVTSGRF